VEAAVEFAALAPQGATPAQTALRWIIQQPGVSTIIPGARNPEQARANSRAAALPPLPDQTLHAVRELYDRRIRAQVHHLW
jgi:aryl-alcohol dehydrogenase-like predicted oxidoreductase